MQIADPALKPKSRPSDRRQVRRNLEAGYAVELIPGDATTAAQRAAFLDLYEQTMRRTDAASHYFFGADYFDRIFPADQTWLALATDPDGAPAAASIACVSDGYLHYYLSGSADARLGDSPMKNVLARLIEHAGRARAAAEPRRRHPRRRRARGVQARLRQPLARLAHLGADLRPGALRRAHRGRATPAASSPPTALPPSGDRASRRCRRARLATVGTLPGLRCPQRAQHRARRRRPVQRVEVDPGRARDEELRALLRRVGDAELELAIRVATRRP